MILYFSGTGNSEYVAKRISAALGVEAVNLFEPIRARRKEALHSDTPWIVVVPTYAWRIPRIVQDWLDQAEFSSHQGIYFVMTCGENIGNAGTYLEKWCAKKGLTDMGCFPIVMPENYIALFSTPARDKALAIVEQAEPVIDEVVRMIQSGQRFPTPTITPKDRLCSGPVNALFYPLFVHAKPFHVTSACIACGTCVSLCPLQNIRLEDKVPVWGKDCTHCMACICRCPVEAIEYGRHSKGLPRYTCPKNADGPSGQTDAQHM